MDVTEKPIPLPRKSGRKYTCDSSSDRSSLYDNSLLSSSHSKVDANQNSRTVPIIPNANVPTSKPVPLPRKLVKRLSKCEEEKIENDDILLPLAGPGKGYKLSHDDEKRMTLNIFRRKLDNPFVDFEENLKDAPSLKTVTSPFEEVPQDVWTRFSSESYESKDCSNFNETIRIEQSCNVDHVDNRDSSLIPTHFMGMSKSALRLEKIMSCPGAPETSTSSRNSSSTDTSESIYEAISSYSSSEPKLSELTPNPLSLSAQETTSSSSSSSRSSNSGVKSNGMSSSNSSFEYKTGHEVIRVKAPFTVSNDNVNVGSASSSTIYVNNNSDMDELATMPPNFFFQSDQETVKLVQPRNFNRNIKSLEVQKKKHEYDEVAMEDGNVILSNRVSIPGINPSSEESTNSSTSNNSCSSLTSRNSVVIEFDPLLRPNFTSSEELDRLKNGDNSVVPIVVNENESPGITPVTQVPPVPSHTDTFIADSRNFDVTLKPSAGCQNPQLFPDTTTNVDEYMQMISEDHPVEHVSVLPLPRPESYVLPSIDDKDKNNSASTSEEIKPCSPPPSNLNVIKVADTSHTNFLRRLSHKIRLIPIKEEVPANNRGTDMTLSSTSSICPKCYEEHSENSKCKFSPIPRENIVYASALSKPAGITKRDFVKRWAALSKGKLTFYSKRGESKTIDNVSLDKVVMISKKDEHRVNQNQNDLKCFQLTLGNGKNSTMVLAGSSEIERSAWMMKYIEVFTSAFPGNIISSYDRGGWCFIKTSVTSEWYPSWFVLSGRKLYYAFHNSTNDCEDYYHVDLRKVREITLSPKEVEHKCSYVDNNEVLTIDLITKILYVQTENVKLTSVWEKAIRSAALFNGITFDEMQLTTENVPVIVDKCIAFLYAHGILSEGIYRQSGANSRIAGLLEDFKKDAWAVSLSADDYSAHDVAGALKRFFRTLPEPLVTDKLYPQWISTFGITKQKVKLQEYRNLLEDLPEINYNIMKKLMCHLYAVHELHEKNLMPLENLSPIWGPTLMNVDILKCDGTELTDTSKLAQSYETALAECGVIRELIENYSNVFRVDAEEISKEKKIQAGLEKFHLSKFQRKKSGDMRIYVHVHEKDENSAISITLTPSATAAAIVEQIAKMTGQVKPYDHLSLHEVIVSKSMERPLFPTEKITETLFRWSMWDTEECKSNYLILKRNTLYPALIPYAKDPTLTYGDFKYADSKSKTFRKYAFEFSGAKLKYFKDSKATIELESWNIEDIVWYIGVEKRRKETPSRFNFTFIPRTYKFKRSKEEPYFGNVVSVNTEEELHKFIAAMIIGEHPEGLYPSIIL